MLIVTK